MRRLLHAAIGVAGFPVWVAGYLALYLTAWLAVVAHRVWPEADMGNCWTHAVPRWVASGGYLVIRKSHGIRLFGWLYVPHVIWLRVWPPDADSEQVMPINRSSSQWLPPIAYFRFRTTGAERQQTQHKPVE